MRLKNKKEEASVSFREETMQRRGRYVLVFFFLLSALCVMAILNLYIGSVSISAGDLLRVLLLREETDGYYAIIWKIRFPRMLMAGMLGGALSVSGFLLQTFFHNPIAGPYVLGISSGAKMAVALTMVLYLRHFSSVSSCTLVAAAFEGSLISVGFILLFSRKTRNMASLLVAGIMMGYICSAVTDFVVTFAEDADIVNLHGWSLGSFSGMNWNHVKVCVWIVGISVGFVFCMSKPISAYQLGETYARSVGVNIPLFRIFLILMSSILSACVTAFAGAVSFVGIAVPHLMKRGLETEKPLIVIPAAFLGGALFCMACDLIARTVFSPMELSISTVTSILGAPVVIAMMLGRIHRSGSGG